MANGAPSYSPSAVYGLPSVADAGAEPDASPLTSLATAAPDDTASPWHPDNPLFWVAGVLALTFGFAFASTTIRVGPVRASASAGKE